MSYPDRLYDLMPVIYRQRDAEQGYPLRALLRVISEQVDAVENDIIMLSENWFIETCADWVVPYIGDLIGYRPVHEAGESGDVNTARERQRNKILIARREVANTIRFRRRKGTLAVLDDMAYAVAGWPARAVEFDRFISVAQWLNHPNPLRGRTADLHRVDALELLGTPFDTASYAIDLSAAKFTTSEETSSFGSVGLFVWRLRAYHVSNAPARLMEGVGEHRFTFSILGNDTPLYTRPDPEADAGEIITELDAPVPIRRRALERPVVEGGEDYQASEQYYGEAKSIAISAPGWGNPIPAAKVIPADLSDWRYRPKPGYVAVDPELGRIAFPLSHAPKEVRVSYSYGFSADIGGGSYRRSIASPRREISIYRIGSGGEFPTFHEAYEKWRKDKTPEAILEITDSGEYNEYEHIELGINESLELRAAKGTRPVVHLPDDVLAESDALTVEGASGSSFYLDGILVVGRGIKVLGDMKTFRMRHSTLVPGWSLDANCRPGNFGTDSLKFENTSVKVRLEHSIMGRIEVIQEKLHVDPLQVTISDSIVDGMSNDSVAISGPDGALAAVLLTIQRCTVLGQVKVHAISLAENAIFTGEMNVARRQQGCMRFCYVSPGSRTPKRYECQPDLVDQAVNKRATEENLSNEEEEKLSNEEIDRLRSDERLRVQPQFLSTRYGKPHYCRLSDNCAPELKRGADDDSEIGVFHDLYEPQREANLRARLEEYVPAGVSAGVIFAS